MQTNLPLILRSVIKIFMMKYFSIIFNSMGIRRYFNGISSEFGIWLMKLILNCDFYLQITNLYCICDLITIESRKYFEFPKVFLLKMLSNTDDRSRKVKPRSAQFQSPVTTQCLTPSTWEVCCPQLRRQDSPPQ